MGLVGIYLKLGYSLGENVLEFQELVYIYIVDSTVSYVSITDTINFACHYKIIYLSSEDEGENKIQ